MLSDGMLLDAPPALDVRSNRLMEVRVSPEKRLALAEADAQAFACNAVNGAKTVILNQTSDELRQWLDSRRFELVETPPLGDFLMADGAAKGLTLRLEEHPPA